MEAKPEGAEFEFDPVAWEAQNYDAVEKKFQEVLEGLKGDKNLDTVSAEYEQLLRAVRTSHDNEKRLGRKCRDLGAELVAATAKVSSALTLSKEDTASILALKKELEKAWKNADASSEKEVRLRETAAAFKAEISNLTKLVEAGAGLGSEDEAALADLQKANEELTRERDGQSQELMLVRGRLMELQQRARDMEEATTRLEAQCGALREQIGAKNADIERETRAKERVEREMEVLKQQVEAKQGEIKDQEADLAACEASIHRLEQSLREQDAANEKAAKEHTLLQERNHKLSRELQEQIAHNTRLLGENNAKTMTLKVKEDTLRALTDEGTKVTRMKDAAYLRLQAAERKKADLEKASDELRGNIKQLEKQNDALRAKAETDKKRLADMAREKDLLYKLSTQAQGSAQHQADLLRLQESTAKAQAQELEAYKASTAKLQKAVQTAERERKAVAEEAEEAAQKVKEATLAAQLQDVQISDAKKELAEAEARLAEQQALYEGVRADRAMYSKNLLAAQDEIAQLRRAHAMLEQQNKQARERNARLDADIARERAVHARRAKQAESLQAALAAKRVRLAEADRAVAEQEVEHKRLSAVVADADQERARLRKAVDAAVADRDALGAQLVRRNDELALLHEKIRGQRATLERGNAAYRERLNDIRVLRLKIAAGATQIGALRTALADADLLKAEGHSLGRAVLQERTKVAALTKELETPLNVHRWRKLEGSDPATFEMIMRCQALQRRLILATEENVAKDGEIQEQEKLHLELKAILARQPGPEAALRVSELQAQVRERTKQLEALVGELNMGQAQADEQKHEVTRLQAELTEMKRLWLEARRRDRRAAAGKGGGAARVLQTVASNVIVEEVVEGEGAADPVGFETREDTGLDVKVVDASSLPQALTG